MSPCITKTGFATDFSMGLSWQGRRLALSRCIPLAAASLHKPNYFCPTNSASATTCLGSKRGKLFVSQCTVWPLHHQSGEPPSYPQHPHGQGDFASPLNPIDHAPTALKGVPAPWNPDHFMETKRAFAPLWKPTTSPMRFGCAPWNSSKEASE
jgi:hypothetical protein